MEVSESPTKISQMDESTKKQKKNKSRALQKFLENSQNENKVVLGNLSEHDDKNQQQSQSNFSCFICHVQLGIHGKKCGFCNAYVCSEHMRKKRKHQTGGKFVRICDNCEDSYLYEKYMKFQMKAQDSLIAQQAIVNTMYTDLSEIVNGKKTKIILLKNKRSQIQRQHKQFLNKLISTQNEINSKLQKMEIKMKQLQIMKSDLQELEKSLPRPLDDDYKSLSQQNQKITKQLVKFEKQCYDAIQVKSKRQKEIYQHYYEWQRRQKNKRQTKDKDCIIF